MSAAVRITLRQRFAAQLLLTQDRAQASGSNVVISRRNAHATSTGPSGSRSEPTGSQDNPQQRADGSQRAARDRWSGRGRKLDMPERPIARRTRAKAVENLDEATGEWHQRKIRQDEIDYLKSRGITNWDRRSDGRRERDAAKDHLREQLTRKEGRQALAAWQTLNAMDFHPPLPSLELTTEVARLVETTVGFDLETFTTLAKHAIAMDEPLKSVTGIFSPFFRCKKEDAALRIVQEALAGPEVMSKGADGHLWHLVGQLVAIGTAAAVQIGKEAQLVNTVKGLSPFPVAGRGAESLDGCPVSLAQVKSALGMLPISSKSREAALHLAEHVTLAWAIEYENEESEKTASIAGRVGSMAGRRDWDGVKAVLERGRAARHTWLKVAADQDATAHWNDSAWSVLLSKALSDKQTDIAAEAWEFYSEVKGPTASPTSRIWTALLSGYAQSRDYDSVMRTWHQLQQTPHAKDWYSITTMISALFRAEQHDQAMLMFEECRRHAKERNEDVPVEVYNSVLLGLSFNFRRDDAFALFDKMLKGAQGVSQPNLVTFNTILRACGRMGDFAKVSDVLQKMSRAGIAPDRITFTTILDAMTRAGQTVDVSRVLDAMTKEDIAPNAVTMTALIKSYLSGAEKSLNGEALIESGNGDVDLQVGSGGRGAERFDLAFEVLDYMERRGPTPTEVTYTALIASLFENPRRFRRYYTANLIPARFAMPKRDAVNSVEALYAERDWEQRPELGISMVLFRRMKQRDLQPNRTTYHTLLAGILGSHDGLVTAKRNAHIAMRLWYLMQRDPHAKPNIQSWSMMTNLLVNKTVEFDRGRDMAFPEMCKRLIWFLRTRELDQDTTSAPVLRATFERAEALLARNAAEQKQRTTRGHRSRLDYDKIQEEKLVEESKFHYEPSTQVGY